MVSISEALKQSSLDDNQWARHALMTLGDNVHPDLPVVAAVAGWTLRRIADGEELVDTLFVLTDTHIGFGQTTGGSGDPRWIPLRSVTSLDAIDDSPLPLQTVEMSIDATMVMLVGWPGSFTLGFVDALQKTLLAANEQSMPGELSGDVPVAGDPSGLDDLGPSQFTEQRVPDGTFTVTDAGDAAAPLPLFSAPSPEAQGDAALEAGDAVPSFATAEQFEPEPPTFGGDQNAEDDPPDAPWMDPGCIWPELIGGVAYLGGHPDHSRKRKGGALIVSRRGVEGVGRGRRSWRVLLKWAAVESMDIQGADEIAFAKGIKINASASALVVTTVDGDSIVFEVSQRRPPSLRAALAPALLMADTARIWRVHR